MHDDVHGERLAGLTHLAFSVLYVAALIWHVKSAFEHFKRIERLNAAIDGK